MTTAAVVGTGFIGPVHIEALQRIGVHVQGILGSTPEKSAQAAAQLGLATGYASYDDMLRDSAVQVIHITTPNQTHFAMASAALNAGKHVICEKPLAMNADETGKLVALAQAHPHLIAAVNYNIRFYPIVRHAHDLIKSGEIGELYTILAARTCRTGCSTTPTGTGGLSRRKAAICGRSATLAPTGWI